MDLGGLGTGLDNKWVQNFIFHLIPQFVKIDPFRMTFRMNLRFFTGMTSL